MAARERTTASRVVGPPRAMAWIVLLASAGAMLVVGILATGLVFSNLGPRPAPPWTFWARLAGACALTLASLSLRSLRWVFLLRRSETRIPIRDAYIGYFAGLSLLFAPLLLGEVTVRALVHRARGGVPILTTTVVNIWERALDLVALTLIVALISLISGHANAAHYVGIGAVGVALIAPIRRLTLRGVVTIVVPLARMFEPSDTHPFERLATTSTWLTALVTSIVAWLLPGAGLWLLAGNWGHPFGLFTAEHTYAASTLASGVALAPGGVLVAGQQMLAALNGAGIPDASAALTVLGIRLATAGLSIALGIVFVLIHIRTANARAASHFDDIADAYDVQIPEARRHALLDKKTDLMREVVEERGVGRRGLDVGCGQGAYVARMRSLGFDVSGIDASPGQVRLAARNVGAPEALAVGSVLDIRAANGSFDFLYIINVLHHLGSVEEQRRAFDELFRVLKPGGLLFVHEINTRNILFRFYMGYVFPSLNCIDEGVERWLLPHRMAQYTKARVIEVRYFTFLPDFLPGPIVRLLSPIERILEGSTLRAYSAHYMAVLEKEPRLDQ